jgi:hypothetical protein
MSKYLALVCLLVGCVPPNGAYQSPGYQSTGYGSQGYEPQGYEAQGYESSGQSGYEGSSPRGNTTWQCTAEGEVSTASDDGPWRNSTERGLGDGPTRDDAYLNAMKNCYALLKTTAALARDATSTGDCKVVDCTGPGTY